MSMICKVTERTEGVKSKTIYKIYLEIQAIKTTR